MSLPVTTSLLCVVLFAGAQQTPPDPAQRAADEARAAERARAAEDAARATARRDQERLNQSMRDFLTDGREIIGDAVNRKETVRETQRRADYDRIKAAFRDFETAIEQLASALGFKAKLKDPATGMERSSAVFLNFIKQRSNKRQRLDAGEFKDFTASQLGWEALATAERVAPQLSTILKGEEEAVVNINFLMSLSKVETELLRLQWMVKKLK
jgi:hypothetical protein